MFLWLWISKLLWNVSGVLPRKNDHMEKFLEPVTPYDFYRDIFPVGSFEEKAILGAERQRDCGDGTEGYGDRYGD